MKIRKNIALSDTGFVFNPTSGESFNVNPLGVEIITLMKEDKDFQEIKNTVLEKYEIDDITFEKDYTDFMSLLSQYDLLEN
ncbi:MAG: PqqD family protein [Bacteroidota bacterium]